LRPPSLPVPEVLDEAVELVSKVAAPWLGILWLMSLPLRLAQAHFVARVHELGKDVHRYGDHLDGLALVATAAFVLSLLGRAAFVTACSRKLRGVEGEGSGRTRPPFGALAAYVYAALLAEVAFYLTSVSFVLMPLFVVLAGLAAATLPQAGRAGLWRPLGAILEHSREVRPLVGLLFVFAVALLVAFANVYLLFRLGLWLAGGFVGADVARYGALLELGNVRFSCLLVGVAVVVVEPWWLAALVVLVHKRESLSSGEDLKLWFARIQGEAE